MAPTKRTLYLHTNRGIESFSASKRVCFLIVNRGIWVLPVTGRALHLISNRVAARTRVMGPAGQHVA